MMTKNSRQGKRIPGLREQQRVQWPERTRCVSRNIWHGWRGGQPGGKDVVIRDKAEKWSGHRVYTDPVITEYGATRCSVRERLRPILAFTDSSELPSWLKR